MTEINGKAASDLVMKQYQQYRKTKSQGTIGDQYLSYALERNPQFHNIAFLLHNLLKAGFYGDLGIKIKDGEIVHVTKMESIKL